VGQRGILLAFLKCLNQLGRWGAACIVLTVLTQCKFDHNTVGGQIHIWVFLARTRSVAVDLDVSLVTRPYCVSAMAFALHKIQM